MIARRGFLASLLTPFVLKLRRALPKFAILSTPTTPGNPEWIRNWTPRATMLSYDGGGEFDLTYKESYTREGNISEEGIHQSKGGLVGSEDGGATR